MEENTIIYGKTSIQYYFIGNCLILKLNNTRVPFGKFIENYNNIIKGKFVQITKTLTVSTGPKKRIRIGCIEDTYENFITLYNQLKSLQDDKKEKKEGRSYNFQKYF